MAQEVGGSNPLAHPFFPAFGVEKRPHSHFALASVRQSCGAESNFRSDPSDSEKLAPHAFVFPHLSLEIGGGDF